MTTDLTNYPILALAAIAQAAELVHAAANGLSRPDAAVVAVKSAITTHHAATLAEIFPDKPVYKLGIGAAIANLNGTTTTPETLRYALQLMDLARRLKRAPTVLRRLQAGLDQLETSLHGVDTGLDWVDSNTQRTALAPGDAEFSALYQDTISTLGKRIQVTGNQQRLQEPGVADSIRSLLLAGVRFAWLWQQLGGSRWQLMMRRKTLLSGLQSLQNTL